MAVCSAEPAFGVGLQRACRARAAYDDAVEVLGWAVDVDALKKVDETAEEWSRRAGYAAEHAAVLASGTRRAYYLLCQFTGSGRRRFVGRARATNGRGFLLARVWFGGPQGGREALRRAATQWGAAHFDLMKHHYSTRRCCCWGLCGALAHLQKRNYRRSVASGLGVGRLRLARTRQKLDG